ncbi:apolipoprotein D-like isoform X3 [Dreissena polymorpha]|uniref:apolipoprotein D-like isoform X3 n=1 Tax=Dreissena polymorpha TaxID=45954 RepID=UPI002264F28B|nr:apolipoprotein D-like isoform X3 [Dreissena polymorpha]
MLPFLLLFFCASIVYGQVPVLGKCPNVTVKMDFEPSKYFGFWYEIARFYTSFEANQKCHSATYTSLPSGHFQVFNQALDMEDHEQNATGDAYIPDTKVKAKIKVKFNEGLHFPLKDYTFRSRTTLSAQGLHFPLKEYIFRFYGFVLNKSISLTKIQLSRKIKSLLSFCGLNRLIWVELVVQ